MRNPRFAVLVRTPSWAPARDGRASETLTNTNKLLSLYPGADGVKTGFTAAAGYTLVASATRGGWQLIGVVLRSSAPFTDGAALLDYGFKYFQWVTLATRGDRIATVTLGRQRVAVVAVVPADVVGVVRRGLAVSSRLSLRSDLTLPIAAGTRVGDVKFVEGGVVVAQSPLIAARRVSP
jgi:D-alanyl-D-alanine carboxypeptidase (penicillin-binding protein 5/6)